MGSPPSPAIAAGLYKTLLNVAALYKHLSRLRFDLPFFYGNFEELIWIVMLGRHTGGRFSHSPAGGGSAPEYQTVSPAWDFQYIQLGCRPMQPLEFRVRTALRPRCSRAEILEAYGSWKRTVSSRAEDAGK